MCEHGALKNYLETHRKQASMGGRKNKELKERPEGCPEFQDLFDWCEQITKGICIKKIHF